MRAMNSNTSPQHSGYRYGTACNQYALDGLRITLKHGASPGGSNPAIRRCLLVSCTFGPLWPCDHMVRPTSFPQDYPEHTSSVSVGSWLSSTASRTLVNRGRRVWIEAAYADLDSVATAVNRSRAAGITQPIKLTGSNLASRTFGLSAEAEHVI